MRKGPSSFSGRDPMWPRMSSHERYASTRDSASDHLRDPMVPASAHLSKFVRGVSVREVTMS